MFEAINGMPLDMLAAVARKVMTIAAAGRLRAKPRLRWKAATKAVRRTRSAIGGSGRVIVAGQSWRTVGRDWLQPRQDCQAAEAGCQRGTAAPRSPSKREAGTQVTEVG